LEKYNSQIQWISEHDTGQANAINKGISSAKGDIFAYLNSDDLYYPTTIQVIVDYFNENPDAMFVYGDALAIDHNNKSYERRHHVKATDFHELVHYGDFIVQPATFWRRSVWEEFGGFDETYTYVFDYEYFLRISQSIKLYYIPQLLTQERIHSQAKTTNGGIARIEELARLGKQYGGHGIPQNFRPEAASIYLYQGLQLLMSGNFHDGKIFIKLAYKTNNSMIKVLIYMTSMIIWGPSSIPSLRLYSNWLRVIWHKWNNTLQ
jgi:glycosyltransferase involved in cell wall biosynthesis